MALTNFASLVSDQKLVWSRKLWMDARDKMFLNRFMGTDQGSVVQVINELTRKEKGEQVIMHLLADLQSDGVVDDNEREGNEEEMSVYTDKITIGMISHGVRQKGKLADQKTVVEFRNNGRERLSYWLANRLDQLGFLTLSGIAYTSTNNGATRTDSTFANLAFASDVSAPTTNRHRRWDAVSGLVAGDTTAVAAADTLTYDALVDIRAYCETSYLKPLIAGGKEFYVVFMRPEGLAQLKKDADYQNAVVTGLPRSEMNPWFTGATVTVDGLVIHTHRLVYNTSDGTSGSQKWGAGSDIDGSRMLVCGPQALGMVDLGPPEWAEKWFQYDSSPGINVDKMFGLLKPKYQNPYHSAVEDFGVLAVDHAI